MIHTSVQDYRVQVVKDVNELNTPASIANAWYTGVFNNVMHSIKQDIKALGGGSYCIHRWDHASACYTKLLQRTV